MYLYIHSFCETKYKHHVTLAITCTSGSIIIVNPHYKLDEDVYNLIQTTALRRKLLSHPNSGLH